MSIRYCICAAMLILAGTTTGGQAPEPTSESTSEPTSRGYTIFAGGNVVGREAVTVQQTADGTTISATGRISGSLDIVIDRAEVRYRADWTPEAFEIEATVNGGSTALYTTFDGETAFTKGLDGGERIEQTDDISAGSLVLPNVFFGAYEALARQLAGAADGQEFPVYLGRGSQGAMQVTSAGEEQIQIGAATLSVRRTSLSYTNPRGTSVVHLYADEDGSLLRVSIPDMSLDFMREDLASSTSRAVVYSNPGDETVTIPAAGFNLGGTLTRPPAGTGRMPAVILLGGVASSDREGVVAGVPILGQLAGAIAEAGIVAVRYDKRGTGQSGGRAESATLGDYAADARDVVRWLSDQPDIDRDRIAVLGFNEGAWTALLVATRERRIAGVVTIASPAATGADRVLEQQRQALARLDTSPTALVARIELQNKINEAAMTGRGWDDIPDDIRRQADTPWFESFLKFDPAETISDVRRPVLLVHGELDAEVPVSHLDRLAEAARDGRPTSVAVARLPGVNHLLLPAVTGDTDEYASLDDRDVSGAARASITDWLAETFSAVR
ncbi:MAG: alpha/beta hydrolase [Acidobacteria bacterium]|nr:alpha/beta hydrolase [Acidobacteriota bacterium]